MIIAIALALFSNYVRAEVEIDCVLPKEPTGIPIEYYKHECAGLHYMKGQQYDKAIKSYKAALALPLFEYPNFELLSRLALAYFKAGNIKKAKENLEMAGLTISVYVGVIKCGEEDDLYDHEDGEYKTGEVYEKVRNIMCGEIYEGYYEYSHSLESVLYDAELVKYYFEVKRQIEEGMNSK